MPARRGAHRAERRPGGAFKPAANRFASTQVEEIQRARILSGLFDVVAERGAGNMSVAHIVQRSGVSRRTFYELFEDREACFLAAFDQAVAYASERVLPAYEAPGRWRERIRAGLIALLLFLDDEPFVGRLLVAESLAGGIRVLERRHRVLAQIVGAIEAGGREAGKGAVPPLTGEGVVGGVLSVLHRRIVNGEGEPLVELTGPLASMIVAPYLGARVAQAELSLPVAAPRGERESSPLLSDPFKDAGMRLTYRTVQVLLAISETPQASNRTIGERAGVKDQGQISKLLARLERIGLIGNVGLAPGQGAPNSWQLTPAGKQVARSLCALSGQAEVNREAAAMAFTTKNSKGSKGTCTH